ncbi:MAG: GerMN domain-containing protein [Spirochaetota bacterium]
MAESSRKRRTSIGVLFWIAFILLVLVIFLANRSNIEQVLESTGIVEVVRDRFTEDADAPAADEPANEGEDPAGETPTGERSADESVDRETEPRVVIGEPERSPEQAPGADPPEADATDDGGAEESAAGTEADNETSADEPTAAEPQRPAGAAQREPSPDPERPNRLMTGLYFIRVTDDGRTFPQRVVRPVYYASSPLTETIRTLIDGPSGSELDDGLLNLIPEGTSLISAHVSEGVAFLNFNQSFRFNPLGAEGTVAQLLQVIYSSTEFPTVERVQFLVEGERVDYLGGDGIYVGEPLGRDAFSS